MSDRHMPLGIIEGARQCPSSPVCLFSISPQEGVVAKLLAGESCAGVFPTGAGKSICYQLPGTLLARQGLGLTLVVSPLIALMKDQVRWAAGVDGAAKGV